MNRCKTIIVLTVAILSVGCTATYGETLDQKIAGKSREEKRTILAGECGREIMAAQKSNGPASEGHSENMKVICELMTGEKIGPE